MRLGVAYDNGPHVSSMTYFIEGESPFAHKVQCHWPPSWRPSRDTEDEADRRVEIAQGTDYRWRGLTEGMEASVLNADDDAVQAGSEGSD